MSKKIAVIGGGALGQYLSARLTQAGHRVSLLLRGDYCAVKENGLKVQSPHGDVKVSPSDLDVFQSPVEIGEADWVICTLKANALQGSAGKRLLKPCIGPKTRVLSLLNGIGIDEAISDIVGDSERVLGGLAFIAASRVAPGEVSHVFTEKITVGHMLDDAEMVAEAVDLLSNCQLSPEPTTSLLTSRWEKVAWNFPFAGMGIVCGGVSVGELFQRPMVRDLTRNVMDEICETANRDILHRHNERKRSGEPPVIPVGFADKLWKMSEGESLKDYLPSTVIDFLNERPVESEFIFGEPLARADRLGLDVPNMRMVVGVIDSLLNTQAAQKEQHVQEVEKSSQAQLESRDSKRMPAASSATSSTVSSISQPAKKRAFSGATRGFSREACEIAKSDQKTEVGAKVVEQYDSLLTRKFYQTVMGGGGNDIHFGIFRSSSDDVRKAAGLTTSMMLDLMAMLSPLNANSKVLDLGSGHGGSTHEMVQRFGNTTVCFNIGEEQNDMNLEECSKLGIANKVSCHLGDFNLGLPSEWTSSFDFVHSCEVLCHAADKPAILSDIQRVLKPAGVLVFSDIMGQDGVDENVLRPFTDRNTTTYMGRPSLYKHQIREAGLREVAYVDLSANLERFFALMLANVENNYEILKSEGLTDEYLNNWIGSLSDRVKVQSEYGAFAWGIFAAVNDTE